ncbi:MAG: SUMF1/EgtB/PvdO family nonheme iron enzyme [Gammaproteobacteria bacterium]|nr:SUMF1/EgtB/PvdO family nonheme iron enzyme [Gammaproteobacteria bacterium]
MPGAPELNRRVVRGGSWNNTPNNVRSANRNNNDPDNRNNNIGFRVLCAPTLLCFHNCQIGSTTVYPAQWKHINGAGASGLHGCGFICQASIKTGHPLTTGRDALFYFLWPVSTNHPVGWAFFSCPPKTRKNIHTIQIDIQI